MTEYERQFDMTEQHLAPGEMQIRLETRNAQFISYARIPANYVPPEVVVWGGRLFITNTMRDADGAFLYFEATSATVADPTPHAVPLKPAAI